MTRGLLSAHQGWDSAATSAIPRALPSYVIPCLSGFDFLFPFQYFMSFCSLLPSPGKPALPGGAALLQQPHEPHVPPEAIQKRVGSQHKRQRDLALNLQQALNRRASLQAAASGGQKAPSTPNLCFAALRGQFGEVRRPCKRGKAKEEEE